MDNNNNPSLTDDILDMKDTIQKPAKKAKFKFFGILPLVLLFFIFLTKRNAWLLNFFNIYIIILFAFNLFNFFYLHKNLNQLKYPTVYSNEIYFTDNEVVNILKNENNKNIYYIVMDSAIPLNNYSEHFKEIDVNKIITDFKKMDFIYIDDVVKYISKLINKPSKNKIPYNCFNIGSDKPQRLKYFLNHIENNLNKKSQYNLLSLQHYVDLFDSLKNTPMKYCYV